MNARARSIGAGTILFLVITVIVFGVLKMPFSRVDVPYAFTGDAIDKLARSRTSSIPAGCSTMPGSAIRSATTVSTFRASTRSTMC